MTFLFVLFARDALNMIHCFNHYYSGLHPVFVEDAKSGSGMCSPVSKSKVE